MKRLVNGHAGKVFNILYMNCLNFMFYLIVCRTFNNSLRRKIWTFVDISIKTRKKFAIFGRIMKWSIAKNLFTFKTYSILFIIIMNVSVRSKPKNWSSNFSTKKNVGTSKFQKCQKNHTVWQIIDLLIGKLERKYLYTSTVCK